MKRLKDNFLFVQNAFYILDVAIHLFIYFFTFYYILSCMTTAAMQLITHGNITLKTHIRENITFSIFIFSSTLLEWVIFHSSRPAKDKEFFFVYLFSFIEKQNIVNFLVKKIVLLKIANNIKLIMPEKIVEFNF